MRCLTEQVLHRSRAGTQTLRLRPRKPDVALAPLTPEDQETSQATFSKAGSGPVAAQAEAVHVRKQRCVGGAPFTWTPSPSSLLLLLLSPSPSSHLLPGQGAVRGAFSPQEGVPSFWGVQRTEGGYHETQLHPPWQPRPQGDGAERAGPSRPRLTCSSGCGSSAPWQRPAPERRGRARPHPRSRRGRERRWGG